jgi:hypothetical protein
MKIKLISLFFWGLISQAYSQQTFDVIIIGGGASGTAAGISAARSGASTLLVEGTPWFGGMLTSAGVSAIDGNHRLPSGIWGEFRDSLIARYGSQQALSTGWVSNTLFEPKVGQEILRNMVNATPNLSYYLNSDWKKAAYENGVWVVEFITNGKSHRAESKILIDATELGDVAASLGLTYRLGMDARSEIGEEFAPELANDIVQDLTYVATLEDFGIGADKTIPMPIGYDPAEFACACAHSDPTTDQAPTLDCDKMIAYGKLPNGKYMINWPNCGNDHYVNLVELSQEEREVELEKAKQTTLRFVYYLQHELGYKHLGLAEGEYPTEDNLPLIPYHRESRRYHGLVTFTLPHVKSPYLTEEPLYRTGIAVGDYTIDHHHKKNSTAPAIDFIKIRVPSYTIPLGALVSKEHPALILAEKSISVSNIVNGATRLQPVVLGIGQAAGVLGALASKSSKSLHDVSIREVQQQLLDQKAYLMPFIDVSNVDPHFQSIQRMGAAGVLKGEGVPYLWANQTWIYPDRLVSEYELVAGIRDYFPSLQEYWGASGDILKVQRLIELLNLAGLKIELKDLEEVWVKTQLSGNLAPDHPLTRREVAVLIDELTPLQSISIDWRGFVLSSVGID